MKLLLILLGGLMLGMLSGLGINTYQNGGTLIKISQYDEVIIDWSVDSPAQREQKILKQQEKYKPTGDGYN